MAVNENHMIAIIMWLSFIWQQRDTNLNILYIYNEYTCIDIDIYIVGPLGHFICLLMGALLFVWPFWHFNCLAFRGILFVSPFEAYYFCMDSEEFRAFENELGPVIFSESYFS